MRKSNKPVVVERTITWPTEDDYKEMNKKLGLNNIKIGKPLTLKISEWCHSYIRNLHIKYPNKEWLAICKTEQVAPWVFELVDMIHPEQTASSWSVTATDKGMDWSVDYLMEKWEDLSKWNLILHSHHHMWVFWSWTDDNARLGYNDGRFMCWAVVTAYSWEPATWNISYKGCVNFYKPYNIEIDCNVEQPERDLRMELEEYLHTDEDYAKALKENKENNFKELILENLDKINEMSDQADYTRIIEYLGIDILDELVNNFRNVVTTKIPNPQVREFLMELEDTATKKAEEETQKEEKEIPQELEDFILWWEVLEKQIEEAFRTWEATRTYSYPHIYSTNYKTQPSLFPSADSNRSFYDDDIPLSKSVLDPEDYDETTIYTKKWFPNVNDLKEELYLTDEDMVIVDTNWLYMIYCKETQQFEYVDDYLDIMEDIRWYVLPNKA